MEKKGDEREKRTEVSENVVRTSWHGCCQWCWQCRIGSWPLWHRSYAKLRRQKPGGAPMSNVVKESASPTQPATAGTPFIEPVLLVSSFRAFGRLLDQACLSKVVVCY